MTCENVERTLHVPSLDRGERLPRDVPVARLRRLQREIEEEAHPEHAGKRRMGRMELAWYLLMLHCGLRTGEVRALRLDAFDLDGRRIRIEQSKGLKDRIALLAGFTENALRAYLAVRGSATDDHVLIYRHPPLTPTYCWARMRTYSR